MKKHKRVIVRILNPIGARTHTSMRCAAEMVQRGIAVYEPGAGIRLINDMPLRLSIKAVEAHAAEQREQSIVTDRGGTIWWDGFMPGSKSEPFTSSVFAPPDSANYKRSTALIPA